MEGFGRPITLLSPYKLDIIKQMIKKILLTIFIALASIFALVLSMRGIASSPTEATINSSTWRDSGPFELSPERGRFALTYSIIENKSMYFSTDIARFVVPDLGYKDGHYVSLFAPGVSYLVAPGYLIGKALGSTQVGTFSVIALFALFNALLVALIARKLGAGFAAASLSGLLFLFATPGFAYAVDLYQHHISTFLILASMFALIRWNNKWSLLATWFLCAASIPVDYPNLFLMFPIGLWATGRFFEVRRRVSTYGITIFPLKALTLLAVLPPLLFFFWFNASSYGNPFQFSGTVASVSGIDDSGMPSAPKTADLENVEKFLHPEEQEKSAISFFKTRSLLNGFYIHSISPDRGTIFFAPVVLFGVIGMVLLRKKYPKIVAVFIAIIGANVLLYSMWGDPWGGWAFGSRYMIPAYAVLSIFIGIFLTRFSRSLILLPLFWLVLTYSIAVNTLGAITSSKNPPQVEILGIEKLSGKVEDYSFDRNHEYLLTNGSKSFVFQTFAHNYVDANTYYLFLSGFIVVFLTAILAMVPFTKKHNQKI